MSENQTSYEGGCACGEIRYRLISKPLFVHCCHCYWCQRETGAGFALNAIIETHQVQLLKGEPASVEIPSNSGLGQTFFRCSQCQIALWSYYGGAGDKLSFVRVGSLDPNHGIEPDIHIFTASKQPWVIIPEGALSFEGFYSRNEHWPEASLNRLASL